MRIYQNADEELRGGDEQDWNMRDRSFAVLLTDGSPKFDHKHDSMEKVRKAQDPKLPENAPEGAVRASSNRVSGDPSQRLVLFTADGSTAGARIREHSGSGILFERQEDGEEVPIAILDGHDLMVISNGEGLRTTFPAMPLSAKLT